MAESAADRSLTNIGSAAEPRQITPREKLRITGMFAEDTGDLLKADEAFHVYQIEYPNDFLGPFYRANIALSMGHPEEALSLLSKAETEAPESFYVPERQARASLMEGNLDLAAEFSSRVRQLGEPGYADRIDGEISAIKGVYGRAESLFAGLRKCESELLKSNSYYLEAAARAQKEDFGGAASILEEGIQADAANGDAPHEAQKFAGLAYVNFQRKDFSGGRDASLKSLALQSDPHLRVEVASLLARNGWTGDAENVLDTMNAQTEIRLLQIFRLRLQGEILLASGHGKEGMEKLTKAWSLDEEHGIQRDYLAHGFAATGHTAEALQAYQNLTKSPGAVWCFAETYFPGQLAEYASEIKHLESERSPRHATSSN